MNKNLTKTISLLLAIFMLSFLMIGSAPKTLAYEGTGTYPTVLVHGLFGWGADSEINEHIPYFGMAEGDLS